MRYLDESAACPDIKKVAVERLNFAVTRHLSFEGVEISVRDDLVRGVADDMVLQLGASLAAGSVHTSEFVEAREDIPKSWWDGFKALHLPTFSRWAGRPPEMREIVTLRKLEVRNVCPHLGFHERKNHIEYLYRSDPRDPLR